MQRKLTDAKIKNLKPRNKGYKSADGGGLYMFTNPKGAKSFRYDFKHHDKYATITFGQYPFVSLAEAREMHMEARKQIMQGRDPRRVKQANQMRVKPFSFYAKEMLSSQDLRPMTASKKLAKMEWHLFKALDKTPVDQITAIDLLNCLVFGSLVSPIIIRL